MHSKDIIKTILVVLIVIGLCTICYIGNNESKMDNNAPLAYYVYLNGENLVLY